MVLGAVVSFARHRNHSEVEEAWFPLHSCLLSQRRDPFFRPSSSITERLVHSVRYLVSEPAIVDIADVSVHGECGPWKREIVV